MPILMKVPFYIIAICCLMLSTTVFAQNEAITEPTRFYRKTIWTGGNANTAGLFGGQFRYGWHKTGKEKIFFDLEIARVRDPKEFRIFGASDNPRRYSFGRLNMAMFNRTGIGKNVVITERPYKNAYSLSINYAGGVTTALLKPIYLDVFYLFEDRAGGFVRSERYDPQIHNNPNLIFGNSPFFTGINESKFIPGAYGRLSLMADWGQYTEEFYALEAGITVDYFPRGLPLMARQPERNWFVILYLGFSYGINK
jgi:hypothetical protein